jgi:hypothetical protein
MTDPAAPHVEASLVTFTAEAGKWIDRVFRDAMRAAGIRGGAGLRERHGPGYGLVLIEYRTAMGWPDGVVMPRGIAETTRYRDPSDVEAELDAAVGRGSITRDADGAVRATAGGHAFLDDLYATQGTALAVHWSGLDAPVSRLAAVTRTLVESATDRPVMPDGTFATMTPNWEPPGTSDAVLLLNRLSAMRYHRSDAHAKAWRAAGMTAAGMVALQESAAANESNGQSRRDVIEARTNEIAAAVFGAVDLAGHGEFFGDLRSLAAAVTTG